MKSIAHQLSLSVTIGLLVYCTYIQDSVAKRNRVSFERFECISYPKSNVSINQCKVKLISRYHIRANIELTLGHQINTFFWHWKTFYKFSSNEYRPFMIDLWDDFCSYMAGSPSLIVGRIFTTFLPFTNMNHTCPYQSGEYSLKINNISLREFDATMLLPSGRYRLDVGWHEIFQGPPFIMLRIYGSISDHRIEIF